MLLTGRPDRYVPETGARTNTTSLSLAATMQTLDLYVEYLEGLKVISHILIFINNAPLASMPATLTSVELLLSC